jgi:hypothetical protein
MKYKAIEEFQKLLYQRLSSNKDLQQVINGVFSYVPKDTKFPYVYIGRLISTDWSTKSSQGLQLLFNINIFSKFQGNKEVLEILFLVNHSLDKWEVNFQNKYLINLKLLTTDIEQPGSNITYQAISRFKVNIEELQ